MVCWWDSTLSPGEGPDFDLSSGFKVDITAKQGFQKYRDDSGEEKTPLDDIQKNLCKEQDKRKQYMDF